MHCEHCGAPVEINEITGIAKCKYCGTVYDLTGGKVDFKNILKLLEQIRYYRNKGILPESKVKIVNGRIIDSDEFIQDGKPPYSCMKCQRKFNLDKIVRHMFSSHQELCDSKDIIPYLRNHPELIFYLEVFIQELEQRETDKHELEKRLEEKEKGTVSSDKSLGKYFFNYAVNTISQLLFKIFLFLFAFAVIAGVLIYLIHYFTK